MAPAIVDIRQRLKARDFDRLFVEDLGWDRVAASPLLVSVDGTEYQLRLIAQKRGAVVCVSDLIPDRPGRARIERVLAKIHFEHVVVYVDASAGEQVWQWAKREPGRPVALREYWLRQGQSGEALAERLIGLTVTLEEEENLTLPSVTARMRRTFDADRVTRAFYDRFKEEQRNFLEYIAGIKSLADREWYASLMLNRLMFTYFIQKKGFLDNDVNYLGNRLRFLHMQDGPHGFLTFYRHFLMRLFHEAFGKQRVEPNPDLDRLIGRVPYLNGGLFEVHDLEKQYPDIAIPDEAFERLFEFFDGYTWHLDERPLRDDREINPDVLGYIFEKYVNQKQMGAYYTKEDITGYMCTNSIIPFLLKAFGVTVSNASQPGGTSPSISAMLSQDPDRYIHSAVRHGMGLALPDPTARGVTASGLDSPVAAGDVPTPEPRAGWNNVAPIDYALPTETWREVVSRRARCEGLRQKLLAGEVQDVDQLVTFNLDLRQLAQDTIERSDDPTQILKFWQIVQNLSVLDPTCGSGAFLFAALNVLEPIYEACIDRMVSFVDECHDVCAPAGQADVYAEFRRILLEINAHPNRRYYVLKSVILNNLFGVDIMEEAVEICKLRLFLKLAAQVEPDVAHDNLGIEPLPDIDFNIRTGNTLIGFTTFDDMCSAIESKLGFEQVLKRVSEQARTLERAFNSFRENQVGGDEFALPTSKLELRTLLALLQSELNYYLAAEYGVSPDDSDYAEWLRSHQPFHWFVEFYGIMSKGGFDLIIGNPPYVEYRNVRNVYRVLRPELTAFGNLHAMVTQVSLRLLAHDGAMSMIVPISLPSTERLEPLRDNLTRSRDVWVSHFDFRPAKLFEGSEQRLTIFVLLPGSGTVYSTRYNRWYGSQRPYLFDCLSYTSCAEVPRVRSVWPKIDGELEAILAKICAQNRAVGSILGGSSAAMLFYKNTGVLYYTAFTLKPPKCFINGEPASSSRETALRAQSTAVQSRLNCLLNSSLFYVSYLIHSNCRDLNPSDIQTFRFPDALLEDDTLVELSEALHENQQSNSSFIVRNQKLTGEVLLQGFKPGLSKPVLDRIDRVLAQYYGLTERELDFIINYDIKYRLGAEAGQDG